MHVESTTSSEGTGRQNIEVWNDLISPRDLVACLLVSAACAVAAVCASAALGGSTLFWGLGASVAGLALCCLLVSPKREVVIVNDVVNNIDSDIDSGPEGDAVTASGKSPASASEDPDGQPGGSGGA